MNTEMLAAALEREHREIDRGIESFLAGRAEGRVDIEPLSSAVEALRRHIFLEEEHLFPPLREAGLVAPIFVMLREHGEIWDTLDLLEEQLRANPAGDPNARTCSLLLVQLERHNSKEEAIVYPQADEAAGAPGGAGLRAFLESGRLPDGWVCAEAGSRAATRDRA